jgi:hypothetical protein
MMEPNMEIEEFPIFFRDSEGHDRTSFANLPERINGTGEKYIRVNLRAEESVLSLFDEEKK